MLRVTKVSVALLVLVPIQGLTAQSAGVPLRLEGEKIRVLVAVDGNEASPKLMKVQGTFVQQRGDSIDVLGARGRLWSLPVSRVHGIEISRGRDRWRGAGFGALAGVPVGLLLSMSPPDCNGQGYGIDCLDDGSTPSTAQYVAANVGMSALLGAMIGLAVGVERWEELLARPRPSVVPAAGGIGLRISW